LEGVIVFGMCFSFNTPRYFGTERRRAIYSNNNQQSWTSWARNFCFEILYSSIYIFADLYTHAPQHPIKNTNVCCFFSVIVVTLAETPDKRQHQAESELKIRKKESKPNLKLKQSKKFLESGKGENPE